VKPNTPRANKLERDRQRYIRQKADPFEQIRRSPAWLKMRQNVLQRDGYTCRRCGARGSHVDHRQRARARTPADYLDERNLWTLCNTCHNGWKQGVEHAGYDMTCDVATGEPLDPSHPWNKIL
jgi:5-methylcytosine-specific restriction protein A